MDTKLIVYKKKLMNLKDASVLQHNHELFSVAFSLDGRSIASGSFDKTVRIWNVENGTLNKILSGYRRCGFFHSVYIHQYSV